MADGAERGVARQPTQGVIAPVLRARLAHFLADAPGGEGRDRELEDLAAVEREIDAAVPLNHAAPQRDRGERDLQTTRPQDAAVEDLGGEARRGLQCTLDEKVAHPLFVDGEFDIRPAAQHGGIEPSLDLTLSLRSEVRGTGRNRRKWSRYQARGRHTGDILRVEFGELLSVLRPVPRFADRRPQFQLVEDSQPLRHLGYTKTLVGSALLLLLSARTPSVSRRRSPSVKNSSWANSPTSLATSRW